MTYPYPGVPAQPGYPQPPAPQVPQQATAPAPPAPVGYPQPPAPQYQPQQVNPYQQPGYPPQYGYPQPQQYQQEEPAPDVSLDTFYSQPSSGWGPAWSWTGMPAGTVYVGRVARPIAKGDVEARRDKNGQLQRYRDGSVKQVMKLPLDVPVDHKYTEGRAQFYVGGAERDELARAQQAVGANSSEPPEAGSVIIVTKQGERKNTFGTMSQILAIQYLRPGPEADNYARQCGIQFNAGGVAPAPAQPPAQPPVVPQQMQMPYPQAPAPPAPPVQPMPQPVAQAPVAQSPAPPVPPAPNGAHDLSPEQLNVLQGLLQQQQAGAPTG